MKMKLILGFFFLLMLACAPKYKSIYTKDATLNLEYTSIQLGKPTSANYYASQVEPSIFIDPNNTDVMIAGSVMNDFYFSADGGKNWESSSLKSKYGVGGDPVVHIDNQGRYYYFHLSDPVDGKRLDRIVCSYKEGDKGQWKSSATKVQGEKAQDKQWVAECPITGNLYLTWTQFDSYGSTNVEDSSHIMFARSENQGETWSSPLRVNYFGGDCLDGSNTVEGAIPAVGPDGTVYVVWTGPRGIRFSKSKDNGDSWLKKEVLVNKHPGGWDFSIPGLFRVNGLPVAKCDVSSSEFSGRIYVNWTDQRNGANDTDVWLSYSDDEGETWSKQIRVNQDTTVSHQFFSTMDIDQTTGYIYFLFYDRRNYSDNQTDVYLVISKDGGASFNEYKINSTPFLPNEKVFFGDYIGIAAHGGVVRPIWSRMDEGKISLWVTLFNE